MIYCYDDDDDGDHNDISFPLNKYHIFIVLFIYLVSLLLLSLLLLSLIFIICITGNTT